MPSPTNSDDDNPSVSFMPSASQTGDNTTLRDMVTLSQMGLAMSMMRSDMKVAMERISALENHISSRSHPSVLELSDPIRSHPTPDQTSLPIACITMHSDHTASDTSPDTCGNQSQATSGVRLDLTSAARTGTGVPATEHGNLGSFAVDRSVLSSDTPTRTVPVGTRIPGGCVHSKYDLLSCILIGVIDSITTRIRPRD